MRVLPLVFATALALATQLPAQAQSQAPAAQADSADIDAARDELRRSREELHALSRRIAELSMQIAGDDIEAAVEHPAFARPALGIVLRASEDDGVAIAAITPNGGGAEAGLRSGDRLLAINGRDIGPGTAAKRLRQARRLIGRLEEGDKVALRYRRGDQLADAAVVARTLPGARMFRRGEAPRIDRERLKVMIANAPHALHLCMDDEDCAGEVARWRALRLAPINPALGHYFGTDKGVLVLASDGSGALQAGDVILDVDGKAVESPREVLRGLRAEDDGPDKVPLRVLRERKTLSLEIDALSLPPTPPAAPRPPAAPPAPPAPSAPPSPDDATAMLI
ncbi:MAG: PDZ domain-containing protein [Lysobacteraceae bacterium]